MAVVLKEQLELRPSVALQKKVGLKSLEQVIRWGDRVNQELRRWRKLEDKKCWRARARCIRKKSRGGSSRLSKEQETGGVRINCPFRRRKDKKKAEKFKKDTRFPLPSGPLWQEYVTMRTMKPDGLVGAKEVLIVNRLPVLVPTRYS